MGSTQAGWVGGDTPSPKVKAGWGYPLCVDRQTDRQTHVKLLPSFVLRTWAVLNFIVHENAKLYQRMIKRLCSELPGWVFF